MNPLEAGKPAKADFELELPGGMAVSQDGLQCPWAQILNPSVLTDS
jgi:hypothetical protein